MTPKFATRSYESMISISLRPVNAYCAGARSIGAEAPIIKMPCRWNSSTQYPCGIAAYPRISSSNSALTVVAGWIERLRPTCGSPLCSPWRCNTTGVSNVPHARTVARAWIRIMRPDASARASKPIARPLGSINTRSARTPVSSIAPFSRAGGTYEMFVLRRASVGHPRSQMPEPSQPGAFRLSGRCDQPSTSAPRAITFCQPFESACPSRIGTTTPVSLTIDALSPTSVTTHGTPQAIDSQRTFGNPSP